ncbi:MAG: HNH endonuclease [Eubacteriales bacterium]
MKYKMPSKADLIGRSSTISNAFAISITPCITPTETEVKESYDLLKIKEGQCAYCLEEGNSKDHLKPLVRKGMPTGYITAIGNLVPCCSACNSSKGAKEFKEWYKAPQNIARLKKKGLDDITIAERFEIISAYEDRIEPPIDYEQIVGNELWNEYIDRKKRLIAILKEDQEFCDRLYDIITKKSRKNSISDIHRFAEKWYSIFKEPPQNAEQIFESILGNDCIALGFELDCGQSFSQKYLNGELFYRAESLKKLIDTVDDIWILGNAILSNWRRIQHWSFESGFTDENRAWFLMTFRRLKDLSCEE